MFRPPKSWPMFALSFSLCLSSPSICLATIPPNLACTSRDRSAAADLALFQVFDELRRAALAKRCLSKRRRAKRFGHIIGRNLGGLERLRERVQLRRGLPGLRRNRCVGPAQPDERVVQSFRRLLRQRCVAVRVRQSNRPRRDGDRPRRSPPRSQAPQRPPRTRLPAPTVSSFAPVEPTASSRSLKSSTALAPAAPSAPSGPPIPAMPARNFFRFRSDCADAFCSAAAAPFCSAAVAARKFAHVVERECKALLLRFRRLGRSF